MSTASSAGPFGVLVRSFGPFCGVAVLVLPAPVCLAADTSPLDGFRTVVCFLPWFANRPALSYLVYLCSRCSALSALCVNVLPACQTLAQNANPPA